jgi:hypothetical protein
MWAFEGHGLEFMPLDVRRKLDLAGLKPSLADWESLTLAQRKELDEAPAEGFAERILAMLPNVAKTTPSDRPWDRAHDQIAARAKELGVTLARWEDLDDSARYALYRLADPKKDPQKFRAAVAELASK